MHLDLVQSRLLLRVELDGDRLTLLRLRLDLGLRRVHVQLARPVGGHDEADLLARGTR